MKQAAKGIWTGMSGEIEPFDNSPLTIYDMERYGVDMCITKPSQIGMLNEMGAALVDKYPDKFGACCSDQTLKLKVWRGEAEWSLEAAIEEIDAALKTGKYVGIGEFLPKPITSKSVEVAGGQVASGDYTFRERLGHIRRFCDLAAKHDVTIDFHESSGRQWGGGTYGGYGLLSKIAAEYPDVSIIICHGGGHTEAGIKAACSAAGRENVYLECGDWPAEYFEIALKNPNIGVTQVIWGHDYGNVPQYITAHPGEEYHPSSYPTLRMRKWPLVPSYQTDFWGWSLHQIHKIRDWVTQDEINLIMGGNAAKIFKLPVPHPRMFPEGRPDLWGIHWEKSIPFLPAEQIQNPDKPYRW